MSDKGGDECSDNIMILFCRFCFKFKNKLFVFDFLRLTIDIGRE